MESCLRPVDSMQRKKHEVVLTRMPGPASVTFSSLGFSYDLPESSPIPECISLTLASYGSFWKKGNESNLDQTKRLPAVPTRLAMTEN